MRSPSLPLADCYCQTGRQQCEKEPKIKIQPGWQMFHHCEIHWKRHNSQIGSPKEMRVLRVINQTKPTQVLTPAQHQHVLAVSAVKPECGERRARLKGNAPSQLSTIQPLKGLLQIRET